MSMNGEGKSTLEKDRVNLQWHFKHLKKENFFFFFSSHGREVFCFAILTTKLSALVYVLG